VYDLTVFKVHFGKLTLKAYTKGERVLRFEVVVHNVRDLGCGRVVERFPQIVAHLSAMLERLRRFGTSACAAVPRGLPSSPTQHCLGLPYLHRINPSAFGAQI
jgi:hypothetical protein